MKDLRALSQQTTLPRAHLVEIGRVVVQFAILEWNLIQLIDLLLETDSVTTRSITSQLPFRSLVDLSSSLVKGKLGAPAAKDYKQLVKLVSAAAEERNSISHSMWGMVSFPPRPIARQTRYLLSRNQGLTRRQRDLRPQDIKALAESISVATYELVSFRKRSRLPDPHWV